MQNLLKFLLATFALVSFFASCHKKDPVAEPRTFVLVHGAFQAPYAWQFVKAQLESKGHKVIVVQLAGHGTDMSSPLDLSVNLYRDQVISSIEKVSGKIVLVGHSLGGMVITATAEKIPERIEKLVYVAGFVPQNGESMLDLAFTDPESLLGPALIPSADHLTLDVLPANIVPIFCQDANEEVKKILLANYRSEPAIPLTSKAQITAANFGKTDKYYIHTLQDHTVGLGLQKRMAASASITKTYSINSSHSPFLSMPESVTNILLEIIK